MQRWFDVLMLFLGLYGAMRLLWDVQDWADRRRARRLTSDNGTKP